MAQRVLRLGTLRGTAFQPSVCYPTVPIHLSMAVGCDVGCTGKQRRSSLLAWSAAPYPPWRRVSCHLPSQGEQPCTEPPFLCNLLRKNPYKKTLPAGIGCALSSKADSTEDWAMARSQVCGHLVSVGGRVEDGSRGSSPGTGLPHGSPLRRSQQQEWAYGKGWNGAAPVVRVSWPGVIQKRPCTHPSYNPRTRRKRRMV